MRTIPMLKHTFDAVIRTSPSARRALINVLYRIMTRLDRDADMVFMNYGYADGGPEPPLLEHDERDRCCIQLYHHVVGSTELRGRDVLEVGSGRGGGASYVARYLGPRTYVGIDRCEAAVRFCNEHHTAPGLSFQVGDAEALPFGDGSFDVVMNVESSHGYAEVPHR